MPPQPSFQEARANRAFAATMQAMARPGTIHDCGAPAQAALLDCLIDGECSAAIAEDSLRAQLRQTGGREASVEAADYVFLARLDMAETLRELKSGSDLYPDKAATAIIGARFGAGPALALSGPGIDGQLYLRVGGLPPDTWAHRAEAIRYPMGIDIILTDANRVIGLPRSTRIGLA